MKRRIFGTVILGISAAVLVACGGGGDSPVASVTTNMTVTPAKGAIYGASATIYQANGTTSLNTGTTGAVSPATGTVAGAATINVGNYSGVAFVKVTGNATATYYDEKTNSDTASFGTTASLVSAVPAITAGTAGDAGVTPFTTMAAKLAGVDTETLGTAGAVGAVPAGFTKNTALEGGARVLLALGLPSTYNIFAKPTPATKAAPTPADPLSNILASMGKNTTSASALELFSTMITNTPKASVGTDGTTSLSPAQVTSFTTAFTAFKAAFDTAAASAGVTVSAAQLNPSTATLATAVTALDAAVKATTTTTAATTTTTTAATTTTTAAATTTTVASTTTTTKAASGSGSGTGSGSGSGSGTGSF